MSIPVLIMLINNLTSRLRISQKGAAARESERLRIKEATRKLRTQAEKIAWHLADLAAQPAVVRVRPDRPR